jgi:hypothetical protein
VKNEEHGDDITTLMAKMEGLVTKFQCSLDVFEQPSHWVQERTFSKTLRPRPVCVASHTRRVICSIIANNVLPFRASTAHATMWANSKRNTIIKTSENQVA